jgi:2-dehydropantoate 2-reductase
MRVLVFGAGVIGSVYAAKLHAAGHEVVVLARGPRLETLRQRGLLLEDAVTRAQTSARVAVIDQLAVDDPYDLVLVPVRFDQLTSTLTSLAGSRRTPDVLFFGNNPLGADRMVAALGRERVVLGFPGAGGQYAESLIRYLIIPQQPTTLGELDGARTKRIERIAGAFRESGFAVALSRDMQSWLKTHAAFVSLVAAAVYAADGDAAKLARSADLLRLMVRAVRQSFRGLANLGIREAPLNLRLLHRGMPEWFAARYWQRQFAAELGQFSLAAHANAAKAEMVALAGEVHRLLPPGEATAAVDELFHRARMPFAEP